MAEKKPKNIPDSLFQPTWPGSVYIFRSSVSTAVPWANSLLLSLPLLFWPLPDANVTVLPLSSLILTTILRARKQEAHTCWNQKASPGTRGNPSCPRRNVTSLCYLPVTTFSVRSIQEAINQSLTVESLLCFKGNITWVSVLTLRKASLLSHIGWFLVHRDNNGGIAKPIKPMCQEQVKQGSLSWEASPMRTFILLDICDPGKQQWPGHSYI